MRYRITDSFQQRGMAKTEHEIVAWHIWMKLQKVLKVVFVNSYLELQFKIGIVLVDDKNDSLR